MSVVTFSSSGNRKHLSLVGSSRRLVQEQWVGIGRKSHFGFHGSSSGSTTISISFCCSSSSSFFSGSVMMSSNRTNVSPKNLLVRCTRPLTVLAALRYVLLLILLVLNISATSCKSSLSKNSYTSSFDDSRDRWELEEMIFIRQIFKYDWGGG